MEQDLRYPIGKFDFTQTVPSEKRPSLLDDLRQAPEAVRKAVQGLSEEQLETAYRPEGWSLRQVVHHLADSHMNSYIRFHLAMTEIEPSVKAYDEKKWAELPDGRRAPVEASLRLLEGLHHRWVALLSAMTDDDWARTFRHSELGPVRLDLALALYSWHGKHHTAHISALRQRMGW